MEMSTPRRNIFGEKCSIWSAAPKNGAKHYTWPIDKYLHATENISRHTAPIIEARRHLAAAYAAHAAGDVVRRDEELKQYKKCKEKAPTALLQGVCPTWHNDAFSSYSKVMCIDIDSPKPGEADNGNGWVKDWEKVKGDLSLLPWTAYCSLSAGGRGVFVLMPIADPAHYSEYYEAVTYVLLQMGLHTDTQCCNIARLRFMTYDPAPYRNADAEVWDKLPPATSRRDARKQYDAESTLNDEQRQAVREAAAYCIEHGISVADDYDTWIRLAAFFAHHLPDAEGESLFHALASLSPKYVARENDYKLRNLSRPHASPIGYGSFVRLMRDNGVPMRGTKQGHHATRLTWHPRPRDESQAALEVAPTAPMPMSDTSPAIAPAEAPLQMSASEAAILEDKADHIAEGEAILDVMQIDTPALTDLINAFGLRYYGHNGWEMTPAQWDNYKRD